MQQLYNFLNRNGPNIVLSINSNHILDSLLFDNLYEFIEQLQNCLMLVVM